MDPLELLERTDKWFLSAADGIIFAPPFPLWLDAPGFWDGATIYQYAFAPLFTVAAVDEAGRELPLRASERRWTPADLTAEYVLPRGIRATEVRTVHPGGIFVSEWRLHAESPVRVHLVGWTAQDAASVDLSSVRWDGSLSFTRTVTDRRQVPLAITAQLACVGGANSWSAQLSERSALQPIWAYTPFVEKWQSEALPGVVRVTGVSTDGLLYGAVHRTLTVDAEGAATTFAMRLTPADSRLAPASPSATPGHAATPGGASRARWRELFARAPGFRCSDPYFEHYYWYRWYGLWLNAIAAGVGNYRHPAMCEGIDFFHQPISYSAQCHVRELRWARDPELARGVLRTFFAHQKSDGSLHGRIYANHLVGTDFYHTDWGGALLALDAVWPDDAFIREMYDPLARYAEWLVRTRDVDCTGMFDVLDQYETGQEYMSRYQAVDPDADRYGWENRIRLKGIDATVYAYTLLRALERIALRAGVPGDGSRWRALADRTALAVRATMWDPDQEMFFDVDPRSGARTGVKAAVCFYPYATDLATAGHMAGLQRHLLDPGEFWTSFPIPSSAVDDPLFDAAGEWKGKRHLCPWNGRVWPMTNSHVVEAVVQAARGGVPALRDAAAQLLRRFVYMMFHDADPRRPNCYEHYNPFSGRPSVYRGIDDYQHSWVNDLIVQYVAGLHPRDGGVQVDPLPLGLELVELTGARVRGATVNVRVTGSTLTVLVDGQSRSGRVGEPMFVPL